MKWIVSAFEPFDKARSNSSAILAGLLAREDWGGRVRFTPLLPVTFAEAWTHLRRELEKDPSVGGVLALGQAETRSKVSLERVALNWIDARIPDNAGAQPKDVPVRGGPDVLWCNIPWSKFSPQGPVERSYSAGTFVCNALMYHLMDWSLANGKLGGFVHIPLLNSQSDPQFAGIVRMDESDALSNLREILKFLVEL